MNVSEDNISEHSVYESNTLVIACNMMRDEVTRALTLSGKDYPVIWIEEGLHDSITKLHGRIQQEFDKVAGTGIRQILLAFGLCGGMINGLITHDFEVIMPNVDDCISLMLYPFKSAKTPGVFYLTRGWLNSNKNAWDDRERNAVRYGEAKADRILKVMLDSYRAMSVIDTGAYPLDEIMDVSNEKANQLGLKHRTQRGSTEWIRQLFTGPYDEKFFRFEANRTIQIDLSGGSTQ
jgi:hypothetical protein